MGLIPDAMLVALRRGRHNDALPPFSRNRRIAAAVPTKENRAGRRVVRDYSKETPPPSNEGKTTKPAIPLRRIPSHPITQTTMMRPRSPQRRHPSLAGMHSAAPRAARSPGVSDSASKAMRWGLLPGASRSDARFNALRQRRPPPLAQ